MVSMATNMKLEQSPAYDREMKNTASETLLFLPKAFINKHLEHLRVTTGLT